MINAIAGPRAARRRRRPAVRAHARPRRQTPGAGRRAAGAGDLPAAHRAGKPRSVRRALRRRRAPISTSRVDWALEWSDLKDRAREPTKRFSGGMKRRLNIACGLVHQPSIVLLDEPTVGVDPQSRERIYEMLAALRARRRVDRAHDASSGGSRAAMRAHRDHRSRQRSSRPARSTSWCSSTLGAARTLTLDAGAAAAGRRRRAGRRRDRREPARADVAGARRRRGRRPAASPR